MARTRRRVRALAQGTHFVCKRILHTDQDVNRCSIPSTHHTASASPLNFNKRTCYAGQIRADCRGTIHQFNDFITLHSNLSSIEIEFRWFSADELRINQHASGAQGRRACRWRSLLRGSRQHRRARRTQRFQRRPLRQPRQQRQRRQQVRPRRVHQ